MKYLIPIVLLFPVGMWGQAVDSTVAEGSDTVEVASEPESSEAFEIADVDEVPVMPGCDPAITDVNDQLQCLSMALYKLFFKTFEYPKEAIDDGAHGRSLISFVIDRQGRVRVVEILQSVHPSIDAEIIRTFNTMPKAIKPATRDGKPVRMKLISTTEYASTIM